MTYAIAKSVSNTIKQQPPKKSNVGVMMKFFLTFQAKLAMRTEKADLARWTKNELVDLGPTFIKIGQFVSTRSDIFDKEIIEELKTLQDKIPAFSCDEAKAIISEDLGRPYYEIFSEFIDEPIASASISQVHKARLASNGHEVVVKVQRPFIKDYFDRDFTTLKSIFGFGDVFNHRGASDSKMLLDDCYKYLYEELSFENELNNIKKFQKIMKYNTEIIVPSVYEEFCSSRVITMEYVPSTKISQNVKTIDKDLTATLLMECFIKQIIDHGMVHADPHPGNIGVTHDGKIVIYDYGQVTTLDESFVQNVKPMLFTIYEKDVEALMTMLIKTKAIILIKPLDKKTIKIFVEQILKYFENVDFKEFQLSMIDQDMGIDLPFKINSKLIMMFRSLSLLEGICKDLDPDFSYFKVINMIMNDVFLDVDYIDHRARKDLTLLFDTSSKDNTIETWQSAFEENNKKQVNNINIALKQYQKVLMLLMMINVWDFENIPKSIGILGMVAYFLLQTEK